MELDLSPKLARKVYGGDGGSYYAWSPSELPMLREGNIGAAKLALEKNGFALPRYSDSAKVAYVLQGIYTQLLSGFYRFLFFLSMSTFVGVVKFYFRINTLLHVLLLLLLLLDTIDLLFYSFG